MKYRIVSDDLRGPERAPAPPSWPTDLAKPIELLLEGKTLFVPDEDPQPTVDHRYVGATHDEVQRVYQLITRKAGRRLYRLRSKVKGVDGWTLWSPLPTTKKKR